MRTVEVPTLFVVMKVNLEIAVYSDDFGKAQRVIEIAPGQLIDLGMLILQVSDSNENAAEQGR